MVLPLKDNYIKPVKTVWGYTPNKDSNQKAGADWKERGAQIETTVVLYDFYHIGLVCRFWKASL